MNSEKFYSLMKIIGDFFVNVTEEVLKQWLGTTVGQRFLKWFTDILVTRFYDKIVEPIVRVGVVRMGYYYDVNDAEEKIKKLKKAEDSNDSDAYRRALNDAFRKLPK